MRSVTKGLIDPGQRVGSPSRCRQMKAQVGRRRCEEILPRDEYFAVLRAISKSDPFFGWSCALPIREMEMASSHDQNRCDSDVLQFQPCPTLERRMATVHWNQDVRNSLARALVR